MALIKYSIGTIISVEDKDGLEEREVIHNEILDKESSIIICSKCGLQHMLIKNNNSKKCSCGNSIILA